jgi:2-polyprenyl-6-methoxyphenol hydroxylase-like FAD-dependent oxidoreductase
MTVMVDREHDATPPRGPSLDALIIGAGPVGLTMAAALTYQGLKYRLIEKAASPTDKSKALVVWSRTLELMSPMGIADKLLNATGIRVKAGSIYADHKRVVHFTLTSDESPYGFPLMLPQSETERVLAEHLGHHGIAAERQVELMSFSEHQDSVVCRLRHPDGRDETVETPWLIGCDGAHSTVRHAANIAFAGHAEPNDWMLADIHVDGILARDEVSVFWHSTGLLVFFPIGADRFRMIADLGTTDASNQRADPTLADVQAKMDERGPGGLSASEPVWLANFRINERKVADYRRGRIMLCGDAAHIHSPAGGQGMNTGMQDALNLAWKLALVQRGEGQSDALLRSYSEERSAIGEQVLKAAETFTAFATLRNPVAQFVRNHLAPIITSFQQIQDEVRRAWQEISLNYRHSPLSKEIWPLFGGGQHAGDRLDYLPLSSAADGRPASLFSVIDGKRQSLLLLPTDSESLGRLLTIAIDADHAFPGALATHVILKGDMPPSADVSSVTGWIDSKSLVHEKLGVVAPTLLLIRPDGYIGYRCQPADGEALLKYLGGFLLRKDAGRDGPIAA